MHRIPPVFHGREDIFPKHDALSVRFFHHDAKTQPCRPVTCEILHAPTHEIRDNL
jgi:hypothetical protein